MRVYMCMHVHIDTHMKARGGHWISSLITLHFYFILIKGLFVYMCYHVCVSVHVGTHTCVHAQRPEEGVTCPFPTLSTYSFEVGLSGNSGPTFLLLTGRLQV